MDQEESSFFTFQKKLAEWVIRLVWSEFTWLARLLIKGLRLAWRGKPRPVERNPRDPEVFPDGPFVTDRQQQMGDLLLWVPRHIESYLINDMTGGYGYSHVTVDTGETDQPTGKPIMIEITVGQAVERKFQDEFGSRPYVRIPLASTGVDAETFISCVKSMLGEKYDNLEAITLGEIDNPAKQVCSGLAADCLPEAHRRRIATAKRLGLLHRRSVSVHSRPDAPVTRVFISPNGFAQYYTAPKGHHLRQTDLLIKAQPLEISARSVARKHGWKVILILSVASALVAGTVFIIRLLSKKRSHHKDHEKPS